MDFVETFLNIPVLRDSLPFLIKGLGMTIQLGVVSLILSFAFGLILALIRIYSPVYLRALAAIYIDFFRATPLLVLLVLVYYALPYLGIKLSAFAAATLSLSIVSSAYAAEVFRSGIEAIPKGQIEAANSIGLSWYTTMRQVVLPQALKLIIPSATGIAVSLIKDTALASVVAMPDLLKQATQAQAFYANPSPLVGAAALYIIMLLPLVRLVSYLEKKRALS